MPSHCFLVRNTKKPQRVLVRRFIIYIIIHYFRNVLRTLLLLLLMVLLIIMDVLVHTNIGYRKMVLML